VFPSVDEFGHASERPRRALEEIDRQLAGKLEEFAGEIVVSADHGLTDTHTHLDLRGSIETREGTTIAFPVVTKRFPAGGRVRVRKRHGQRLPSRRGQLDRAAFTRAVPRPCGAPA
jgi:hypothetical protein